MVARTLLFAVSLTAAFAALPSAQSRQPEQGVSDLDRLMAQVLEHQDQNWKKLQQYTLTERETLQITALAAFRLFGFEREYLWFPRSGPGTPSFDKAVSVWCATDRNKAFTDAKSGTDPKNATCENPIAEEFELGRRVGINGTPTVIAPDGTQIGGYLAPEAMRQRLDSLVSAK